MNKAQTKQLEAARISIDHAKAICDELIGDLQSEFDELSEKAQEGDKGEALQTIMDTIQAAADSLDEADSSCAEALT